MFIVIYDDSDNGIIQPMGWDEHNRGAIHARSDRVAVFGSRKEARRAIKISTAVARLNEARGEAVNTDFTEFVKHVRIVPLVERKGLTK